MVIESGSLRFRSFPCVSILFFALASSGSSGTPPELQSAKTFGSCHFDHECDDCRVCTDDECVNGVCVNTPQQACVACYDDLFCNGWEICDLEGNCAPSAFDPCDQIPGTICDEEGEGNGPGECVAPCTTEADCDDGLGCTGTEVCVPKECVGGNNSGVACASDSDCDMIGGGFCGGVCRHVDIPCGLPEACIEKYCPICNGPTVDSCRCTTDSDCGIGQICILEPSCVVNGRCCTDDGSGQYLLCTRSSWPDCDAANGRWLFVGDDPAAPGDQGSCTDVASSWAPYPGEDYQCPVYSSGIAPAGTYVATVGPIGLAACAAFHEIGDDYVIAGADAGNDAIEVTTIRYVGGFQTTGIQGEPSVVRITIYAESGRVVYQTLTEENDDDETQLRTVVLHERPIVPARGWLAISSSQWHAPFGRHHWMSTDAVDTGDNDETLLWVDGGPAPVSSVLPTGVAGILAFEIVGDVVPLPTGACCNSGDAVCSVQLPWECDAGDGVFRGVGSDCQPMPFECAVTACCDSSSGACIEVTGSECSDTQEACLSDAECTGIGAVCQPPCPINTVSHGFGTTCVPNLCQQPQVTGYDTCTEAALVGNHLHLNVVTLSDCETVTATVSGNNLEATMNDNPGSCENNLFSPIGPTKDRGWWHAIETLACTNLRIDFCGTEELYGDAKETIWDKLWEGCDPCAETISASRVGGIDDGGCVGLPLESQGTGSPFCAGDDAWVTFGPLPAGMYWYPVHSAPGGTFGPYQFHVTASACDDAACCLPQGMCVKSDESLARGGSADPVFCDDDAGCAALTFCDNNADVDCIIDTDCPACLGGSTPGAPCVTDFNCGAGGTCNDTSTCRSAMCEFCAVMNELECDSVDGKWNGFGSVREQCSEGICVQGICVGGYSDDIEYCDPAGGASIVSCESGDCDIGSCCEGSGGCVDYSGLSPPCYLPVPESCMSRAQCETVPGATFVGGAGCLDFGAPCPACGDIGDTNCQFPLGDGFVFMSDLTAPGSSVVTADDFVPFDDTLTSVCVWGTYLAPSGPGATGALGTEQFGCTGWVVGEQFRVRVFRDGGVDTSPSTAPGLPGTLIGQALVSGNNIARSPLRGTFFEDTFGIEMQAFQLTLDFPITGLQPGVRHWIEVVDHTPLPERNTCHWHWAQHISSSRDGYSATGISPAEEDPDDLISRSSIYVNGSARSVDLAFCLSGPNGPLDFDSPPAQAGACWTCGDWPDVPVCTATTLRGCMQQNGRWSRRDPTCLNAETPPVINDFCGIFWMLGKSVSSAICGDGVVDPGEQCDDGNVFWNDGCGADCQLECPVGGGPAWINFPVAEGLYPFDNTCAARDGPFLARGEQGDFRIDGDLWYAYTATGTGVVTISTCATQTAWNQDGFSGLDAGLAIYHEFVNRCADGPNDGQLCQCPGTPPKARCVDTVQCPGGSGVCRNVCPCPGAFAGVSPFQIGTGSDEGCNGLCDQGGGVQRLTVFPNECYLIRVGSSANPSEGEESPAKGRGLLDISLLVHTPPPLPTPQPHLGIDADGESVSWAKPRMISFQGGEPGRDQAVRVTFDDMPPGWETWNGQKRFVQPPWIGSESPGTSFYDPPAPGAPSIQLAELDYSPYYTDWSVYGVVHVIHPAIAPSRLASPSGPIDQPASFVVQITDEICNPGDESCYSPTLEVRTAAWGDVVSLAGGMYRTPDDNVSVVDLLAMIASFSGQPDAPSKASMSLVGVFVGGPDPALDGKITINEVVAVLGAFQGDSYPFTSEDLAPPVASP